MQALKISTISAAIALLNACGGGGSSSSTAATATVTTSFPLQSAQKALFSNPRSTNFTVSGTCSGSATLSVSATSAATFEGASALSATGTITSTYTNCTPSSNASTSIAYYDSNYNLLGSSAPGQEYAVMQGSATPLPTSVKAGDTAVYGTETVYSDSSKSTITGQRVLSYVIEQDGSSTNSVIANEIVKNYNASNQLTYTNQSRYRLTASGTLTPVSIDLQYSTTSSTHLILTAQ